MFSFNVAQITTLHEEDLVMRLDIIRCSSICFQDVPRLDFVCDTHTAIAVQVYLCTVQRREVSRHHKQVRAIG